MPATARKSSRRVALELEAELVRLEIERRRRERERQQASPPIWRPNPGPQTEAVRSEADVIGYGGAAGGGKTSLAIGLALTAHRRSIIFRREFVQLRGIIAQTQELLTDAPDPGRYNANDLIWRFADGRSLELGAVKQPDDWRKYKGRPHDFICFDEATEFLESQVRSLIAWLRTTDRSQRCRAVLGFNPPTATEGRWVRKFFAPWLDLTHPRPAAPGELRWYATIDGEEIELESGVPFEFNGESIYPLSRTFFPARLSDNPYQDSPEYRAVLNSLPEPLRSQLLYGDMEADAEPDPWQVIPTAWVQAAQARWAARQPTVRLTCIGMDVAHGGKDSTVLARRYGNYFAELLSYPGRETPDGASAAARAYEAWEAGAYLNVDAIGYGATAHERLRDRPPGGYGVPAHAVNFAAASKHTDRSGKYRMTNLRAEAFWRIRESLDPDLGDDLALPPDPELLADLCACHYRITPSGIRIEDKLEIKARIGRSPDKGDAVALAMLPPPSVAGPPVVGGSRPAPVIPGATRGRI